MADRTTAKLFCDIFELLAEAPITEDRKALALRVYKMTQEFDFCDYQMNADAHLGKLDLFRVLPEQPGDMEPRTEYGPLKGEPK